MLFSFSSATLSIACFLKLEVFLVFVVNIELVSSCNPEYHNEYLHEICVNITAFKSSGSARILPLVGLSNNKIRLRLRLKMLKLWLFTK